MSVRRVLVDCVVLSVQDSCVFYPNCRSCFSRLDVEQVENRCRCSRCGYMCVREQVDYRYRLSLKVERSSRIIGITVFGSSLNQFFGVQATALQRLVEHQDGPIEPSARVKLLLRATEDCFIGRHFIFGLKLTDREKELWLEGSLSNGSKDVSQFVASQMILPDASGLAGSTVVRYYQALLHKASEYQLVPPYLSKGSRFPETPLLLDPRCSPRSSFDDVRLSDFRLLSQPCKRSLNCSGPLSPTPPWQQSLGVITSSAEQEEEEGEGAQGSEEHIKVLESHGATKQDLNLSKSQSFPKILDSAVVNSSSRIITSQPVYKTNPIREVSSNSLSDSFLSNSKAQWEDLPFSESLTEFFGENNEHSVGFLKHPEHSLHVFCQKETRGSNPEVHSPAVCQNNSQMLLDITNTPATTGNNDFTKDTKTSSHKNKSPPLNTSHCIQKDEESNVTFERELKDDAYNCSADLFSGSLMTSTSYDVISSSPHSSKTISSERNKKDSFIPQDVDFVPPSQSTPLIKPSNCYKHTSSSQRNNTKHNLQDFRKNLFNRKIRNSWKDLNPVLLNCSPVSMVCKTMKFKRSAGVCDDSMCDADTSEMLVPPTPAGNKKSSECVREIRPTDFNSGDLTHFKDEQQDNGYREKTPSTHANTGVESTGKRDMGAGNEDDSINNESLACDWSRDLFSDSL